MKISNLALLASCAAVFVLSLTGSRVFAENVQHGGDIIYTEPLKSVIFSHKIHVEEKGLSCEMCHNGLFAMQALKAQENKDFVMESLYQGKYCGACHNGSIAFSANSRCATCHSGVKGFKRAKGEPAGGHEKH